MNGFLNCVVVSEFKLLFMACFNLSQLHCVISQLVADEIYVNICELIIVENIFSSTTKICEGISLKAQLNRL